jgi:hypothetical protein
MAMSNLPPLVDLDAVTAEAWMAKKLPPRDFLMGTALSTTSKWMIIGDTGVGKTLLGIAVAMIVAANQPLLHWGAGGLPRVVMYIDGDMPAETFQERIKLAMQIYGAAGMAFYGYNLDELDRENKGFEPFNTPDGRAWLEREIDRVRPDLIIFDSIMCLTVGALTDDRAWGPVAELMGWLTGRRIAQIWLHHTGHDPTRGYGLKAREWRLDTVIMLIQATDDGLGAEDGAPIEIRFSKARLRTPHNKSQFEEWKIAFGPNGWRKIELLSDKKKKKGPSNQTILVHAFCDAYDRLAGDVAPTATINGYKVLMVPTDRIRDELRDGGFLDTDDQGRIEAKSREALRQTKLKLLADGFMEKHKLIWRTKPPPSRAGYA